MCLSKSTDQLYRVYQAINDRLTYKCHVTYNTSLELRSLQQYQFIVSILPFSVLQKLEVLQGTTVYGYLRNREFPVAGPSCPKLSLLGSGTFSRIWCTLRLKAHLFIKREVSSISLRSNRN